MGDVYYGVDVFGRGCLGGGGFNCQEAIRALVAATPATSGPFSVALFAPGWVLETQLDADVAVVMKQTEFAGSSLSR